MVNVDLYSAIITKVSKVHYKSQPNAKTPSKTQKSTNVTSLTNAAVTGVVSALRAASPSLSGQLVLNYWYPPRNIPASASASVGLAGYLP